MLKRRDIHFDDLPFPKTPRKLPTVLSPEEVHRMIEGTTNLMHRTLLMVLYGTGVRRTELSLLKVADIDSKRMVVHIRQGKGSRDRDVPLSPKLLEALREYWRWKKPRFYLFPSTEGHRGVEAPMSDKVVWWAVREAARRAGITMQYLDVALHDLQREFELARSKPRHLVTQPRVPSAPLRAGLDGLIDSLLAAQHLLEMFRRALPDGTSRRRLARLSNRLTKIVLETRKLRTP